MPVQKEGHFTLPTCPTTFQSEPKQKSWMHTIVEFEMYSFDLKIKLFITKHVLNACKTQSMQQKNIKNKIKKAA